MKIAQWVTRDIENFKATISETWSEFKADPVIRTALAAASLALILLFAAEIFMGMTE